MFLSYSLFYNMPPFHHLYKLTFTVMLPFTWGKPCALLCDVCFGGAGSYSTDLENESGIYLWEFL